LRRLRCAIALVIDRGLARGHLVSVDTWSTACGLDATGAEPIHLHAGRLNCRFCATAADELGPRISAAVVVEQAS
jgi:hypothetical protein